MHRLQPSLFVGSLKNLSLNYLSFASSTFEGQGARSGGQEECSVRLFAIFVCMSKVSSRSLLLAPCSLTQLAKVELISLLAVRHSSTNSPQRYNKKGGSAKFIQPTRHFFQRTPTSYSSNSKTVAERAAWAPMTSTCAMSAVLEGPLMKVP